MPARVYQCEGHTQPHLVTGRGARHHLVGHHESALAVHDVAHVEVDPGGAADLSGEPAQRGDATLGYRRGSGKALPAEYAETRHGQDGDDCQDWSATYGQTHGSSRSSVNGDHGR